MESAQVLSNSVGSSRKQEHLEAGKRRLEEFRKKKAAAQKAASTSQSRSADSTAYEKQASENVQAHIGPVDAIADGKSDIAKAYSLLNHNDKSYGFILDGGSKSVPSACVAPQSHHMSFDLQKMEPKQEGKSHDISGLKPEAGSESVSQSFSVDSGQTDDQAGSVGSTGEGRYADGIPSFSVAAVDNIGYHHSKSYGAGESLAKNDIISESFQNKSSAINDVAASVYSDKDATNLLRDKSDSADHIVDPPEIASEPGHGQREDWEFRSFRNNMTSGLQEANIINTAGKFSSFFDHRASEPISTGSSSDATGSFNGLLYSAAAETHPRRSRTSFISSLNLGRDPPAADSSYSEKEKLTTSKFQSSNFAASALRDSFTASGAVESLRKPASPPSSNNFGSAFREQKLFDSLESKLESNSQKQNEDFAALEQHIEDLTQEKFSLQRALDTSKALAESLASENSSLTESYNQQASIVTQLKAEMERLQGEIKARMVELESIKAEYMNVQLECNAADERAKLLASEVIGLEEKALRLRSNELKLERELDNLNAEIASYKKKMCSLEKERQDLLQTIDALQEEKKLLQSKLRKTSAGGMSVDINQGRAKKDASTCTNDLGLDIGAADRDSSGGMSSDLQGHDNADNLLLLAMHRPAGGLDTATAIPPDQVQMIQNINSLISEIMEEKEELVQALMAERMASTKLTDLNKELSQKLEVQTQRLELLTSQSMASENIPARQPTGPRIARETGAYADEGDEVVERVLGWIMKLFPGGPSKRKTSRL